MQSYHSVDVLEFLVPIIEGNNFSGANEGEIQRIEKQNNILS